MAVRNDVFDELKLFVTGDIQCTERHARIGEYIKITEGSGHSLQVGDIVRVVDNYNTQGYVWVHVSGWVCNIIRKSQYVVLEIPVDMLDTMQFTWGAFARGGIAVSTTPQSARKFQSKLEQIEDIEEIYIISRHPPLPGYTYFVNQNGMNGTQRVRESIPIVAFEPDIEMRVKHKRY